LIAGIEDNAEVAQEKDSEAWTASTHAARKKRSRSVGEPVSNSV
jgi:hypothetical protein